MLERELIVAILSRTNGQLSPAARHLGISRTTLRKKIAQHGIRATVSVNATMPHNPDQ